MKIINLQLENFRGIKKIKIDFATKDTNIYGTNGSGKTTIANAISWLIVDSPITGEKDFSPKTVGVHNLHHKAEMKVLTDNGEVTFTKDFYELWQKKRGSTAPEFSGHTTDYYVDGVPVKKKDYEREIEFACGASIENIKMLLILGYFSEVMKPEARRKVLFDVCGDVPDDKILEREDFEYLRSALIIPGTTDKKYSVEDLKKIKFKAIQGLKKDLTAIPERIDELTKQIVENISDEDTTKKSMRDLSDKHAELKAQLKDENKETLIKKIRDEISTKKFEYQKINAQRNEKTEALIAELRKTLRDSDYEIDAVLRKRTDIKNQCEYMRAEREKLVKEFEEVKSSKFSQSATCPTCGQPMPESRMQVAHQAWEEERLKTIKSIQTRGQSCSKEKIEALEEEQNALSEKLEELNKQSNELSEKIRAAGKTIERMTPFEETEEYIKLSNQIKEAECVENPISNETQNEITEVDKKITELEEQLAQIKINNSAKTRIAELEAEQKDKGFALEAAEHIINLCEQFTRTKVSMVTDNINEHFSSISFQLFREQINGGLKECCEALIPSKDGTLVEYRSANTAAKVNAGLEIVSVLNRHFGTNIPVIIDSAESICNPRDMSEQVIKLIVSETDEKIRIKMKE